MNALSKTQPRGYELCFERLSSHARTYVFACDCEGRVDLDGMSDRARNNYLFARSVIGRDVTRPRVQAAS
jgi:hypothetical protein